MEAQVIKTRKPSAFDKRIHEIDFVRGILIILVLFDHLMNRLAFTNSFCPFLKELAVDYWQSDFRDLFQQLALMGFCITSGISCAFSKDNKKRAIELLTIWFVLFVGTRSIDYIFDDQLSKIGISTLIIDFNVIGVLAFSSLFYTLVENKSSKSILALLLVTYVISTYVFPIDYQGKSVDGYTFYAPALFYPKDAQADWMPLLPFMVCFLGGALFSYFFYKDRKQSLVPKLKGNYEKPICFLGRHTLIIYALHQGIYIPLFVLLNEIGKLIQG